MLARVCVSLGEEAAGPVRGQARRPRRAGGRGPERRHASASMMCTAAPHLDDVRVGEDVAQRVVQLARREGQGVDQPRPAPVVRELQQAHAAQVRQMRGVLDVQSQARRLRVRVVQQVSEEGVSARAIQICRSVFPTILHRAHL